MRTRILFLVCAVLAGCAHIPRSTTWTGGEVAHQSCVGRDGAGNCVAQVTGGEINGDRLPSVVTATAVGEATITDARTRAAATQARGVREFRATDALAAAYQECMRDEDADAFICGGPFVVEAANGAGGYLGGGFTPYGMAPRTVRAVTAVYGGYAPLGVPYSYGGGRRASGEAVDAEARRGVVELAGALVEHTEGGGR